METMDLDEWFNFLIYPILSFICIFLYACVCVFARTRARMFRDMYTHRGAYVETRGILFLRTGVIGCVNSPT